MFAVSKIQLCINSLPPTSSKAIFHQLTRLTT